MVVNFLVDFHITLILNTLSAQKKKEHVFFTRNGLTLCEVVGVPISTMDCTKSLAKANGRFHVPEIVYQELLRMVMKAFFFSLLYSSVESSFFGEGPCSCFSVVSSFLLLLLR